MRNKIDWIKTPGLQNKRDDFKRLYMELKGSPVKDKHIMILGPTGVGKSMFIDLFKSLYGDDENNFVQINIAAISENLVESELFGHVKGAFTGAAKDKKGLLEKADNGVLILEEVGDIPKYIQAKLLTFLEDGHYYKVGSVTENKATVQVIATTNKTSDDESLRADFLERFNHFKVPPVYERRRDILHYLQSAYPEIIESLRPCEILVLLAYHWPGNVREVLRVGRSLKSYQPTEDGTGRLLSISLDMTDTLQKRLYLAELYKLIRSLNQDGINVNLLEKILNKYNIGIQPFNNINIFKKGSKAKTNKGDKGTLRNDEFEKAYRGFKMFCNIFCLEESENMPLMDFENAQYFDNQRWWCEDFKELKKKYPELINSIAAFTKEYRLPKDSITHRGPMLSPNIVPTSLSEKELLKQYYLGLLKKTKGNKKQASKLAGIEYTTFLDRLKKYGH